MLCIKEALEGKEPSLKRASPEQILLIESERLVTAPRNAFASHRAIVALGEHPKSTAGSMFDDRESDTRLNRMRAAETTTCMQASTRTHQSAEMLIDVCRLGLLHCNV